MDGGCDELALLALCGSGTCLPHLAYIVLVILGMMLKHAFSIILVRNFRTDKLHTVNSGYLCAD